MTPALVVLLAACTGERASPFPLEQGRARGTPLLEDRLALEADASEDGALLGAAVDRAGDVNGDGHDDLLVGAPGLELARLYLGGIDGLDAAAIELVSPAGGDRFGASVAGLGDVDGDGYDDVVVGAPWDDDQGLRAGAAWLYLGGPSGPDPSSPQRIEASRGDAGDLFGSDVSSAGDVDGDGLADLVVGAPGDHSRCTACGLAYVFRGDADGLDPDSEQAIPEVVHAVYERCCEAVAGVGDVDGDGYDDVLLGATSGSNSWWIGETYLIPGSRTGMDPSGEVVFASPKVEIDDHFGASLAPAGDVNGDGYADVIVGAPGSLLPGYAAVYLGDPLGLLPGSEVRLTRSSRDPSELGYGEAVAGAGDLNADGYDDVAVGAPSYGYPDLGGEVDVYPGSASGLASIPALTLSGAIAGDALGQALCLAGDYDSDGFYELVVGRPGFDGIAPGGGRVEVYGCLKQSWYADVDGDGHGDADSVLVSCIQPDGYVAEAGDCDDLQPATHPGAAEVLADGADQDCDGTEVCLSDADDDGYTEGYTVLSTDTDCDDPGEGRSDEPAGDCDPTDAEVHPGAEEIPGDGVDQDCDGAESCLADEDGDGHASGQIHSVDFDCDDAGEVEASAPADDCDDTDPTVHPGAEDACGDGVDSDCDGTGGPEDDEDGDGLSWTQEDELGTDPCLADTDGDGLLDGEDEHPLRAWGCCTTGPSGPVGLLVLLLPMLLGRRRRTRGVGLQPDPRSLG